MSRLFTFFSDFFISKTCTHFYFKDNVFKHCNQFTSIQFKIFLKRQSILICFFRSVQDIDLYAGGLSEDSLSDTEAVGRTFGCIIMNQFRDLKNGDRFYYENGPAVNPSAFTATQLQEIKKVTMSGLICNNYDLSVIQRNAFLDPMAPGYFI